MTLKSSSKEAPDLPQNRATVSLWDLVGEAPATPPPKTYIVDDSFYPAEMTCSVPSQILRVMMPDQHLSQMIEWLHRHVDAQRQATKRWQQTSRRSYLASKRRHARKKALEEGREPEPLPSQSKEAKAEYMRRYRENRALLKKQMKGGRLTLAEGKRVERHKARLMLRRMAARLKMLAGERRAVRLMKANRYIFNPKSS